MQDEDKISIKLHHLEKCFVISLQWISFLKSLILGKWGEKVFYPYKVQRNINNIWERHFKNLSICRLYPTFSLRVIFQFRKPYMWLNINAEKCSTVLMQSLLTAGDIFSKVFEITVNKWIKTMPG